MKTMMMFLMAGALLVTGGVASANKSPARGKSGKIVRKAFKASSKKGWNAEEYSRLLTADPGNRLGWQTWNRR